MQQTASKIKILTYNVFMRPPPIKTNQSDYKDKRLQDIIKTICNFDIISFQQIFQTGTFRKQQLIQAAMQQGFFYWKDCQSPDFFYGPPVDSGLLVISKYPIIQSVFQSYNVGILSDSASDKGFIYCKIKIENSYLHLINTHLQASYFGNQEMRQLSIKTRLYQFKQLLKRVKHYVSLYLQSQNDLILLNGDLNMNSLMNAIQLDPNSPLVIIFYKQTDQCDKGHFLQYQAFMKIFKENYIQAIDYCHLSYGKHPITFGDGDTILTGEDQSNSKQSLDYIFKLQIKDLEISQRKKTNSKSSKSTEQILIPLESSCAIEQFKIKDSKYFKFSQINQQRKYIQLSDHYGVSIDLEKVTVKK